MDERLYEKVSGLKESNWAEILAFFRRCDVRMNFQLVSVSERVYCGAGTGVASVVPCATRRTGAAAWFAAWPLGSAGQPAHDDATCVGSRRSSAARPAGLVPVTGHGPVSVRRRAGSGAGRRYVACMGGSDSSVRRSHRLVAERDKPAVASQLASPAARTGFYPRGNPGWRRRMPVAALVAGVIDCVRFVRT